MKLLVQEVPKLWPNTGRQMQHKYDLSPRLTVKFESVGCILTFEFFYNSLFSAKSLQNPASIDEEEQNKKMRIAGIEPTTSRSSL